MTIETGTLRNDRGPAAARPTDQTAEEIRMGIIAEVEVMQMLADPILLTAMGT
jgi:hypothetical protein